MEDILAASTVQETNLQGLGRKYVGKVRDCYEKGGELYIVTTDRQSAFDRAFPAVPFKGQVLTRITRWWFERTEEVCQNHVIDYPDPQVMRVKKLTMAPIEMVVRAYITGSTDTSLWAQYEKGARNMYGLSFPEGLKKNEKLPKVVLTPTTKGAVGAHDEPIYPTEIVEKGLLTQSQWNDMAEKSLALFARGRALAAERGLILVDTKFEFGWDEKGVLTVADEIFTPDSSRYWKADSYEKMHSLGKEPEALDKEFLRLWVKERCNPYTENIPTIPPEVIATFSKKYQQLLQHITGESFMPAEPKVPALKRIERNMAAFL